MRRMHKILASLAGLGALPLLVAANEQVGAKIDDLNVTTLPSCAESEYLVYKGGTLACAQVQAGTNISFPDCTGKLLTSSKTGGDITSLSCTDKGTTGGTVDMTKLSTLETNVTNLG